MKQLNFKWVLGMLYAGVSALFLIYNGVENVVSNDVYYLIAPFTAVTAGFIALFHIGWGGKRAMVIRDVLTGSMLWFIAEVILLVLAWKDMESYPSLADTFFLVGYFFFARAIIRESKLFEVQWKKLHFQLVAVLMALFAGITGLVTYVGARGYDSGESILVNFTTISWSLGDLIVGGLALVLLAMAWEYRNGTVRREWLWFIGAIFAHLIADTVYSFNPEVIVDGSWLNTFLNILWMGGYFLFAGYFLEIDREMRRIRMTLLPRK